MVTKSGKEIELKLPTRREAIKFKLASVSGYDGYEVYYDAALSASGMAQPEFESKFTDEDILEIASEVFKMLTPSDEQKKS